jgi:preprotein translocase subunit SecB
LAAEADSDKGTADQPSFGYQLVDSYLLDASVTRRSAAVDELERPNIDLSLDTEDRYDLPGFLAVLSVDVQFQFLPEAICEIRTRTMGVLRRVGEMDPSEEKRFRETDCAVLLWPYARTNVGELVRMLGLSFPPLPTLDARRAVADWREKNAAVAKPATDRTSRGSASKPRQKGRRKTSVP